MLTRIWRIDRASHYIEQPLTEWDGKTKLAKEKHQTSAYQQRDLFNNNRELNSLQQFCTPKTVNWDDWYIIFHRQSEDSLPNDYIFLIRVCVRLWVALEHFCNSSWCKSDP